MKYKTASVIDNSLADRELGYIDFVKSNLKKRIVDLLADKIVDKKQYIISTDLDSRFYSYEQNLTEYVESININELVQCKDCVYAKDRGFQKDKILYECELMRNLFSEDFFCANGANERGDTNAE